MTYVPLPKPINIPVTLSYIASAILNQSAYSYYDPVGGYPNQNETEYNSINWIDARPKPSWSDIVAYHEAAWDHYQLTGDREWIAHVEEYLPELDDKDEELEDAITDIQADITALEAISGPHTHVISDISGLQTALNSKAAVSHTHTPSEVGLGNVDNTSDADKPISTAVSTALSSKVDVVSGRALSTNDFTDTLLSKLNGIATGATANSSDATLLARANHTGTQAISTVSGLQAALDAKAATSVTDSLETRLTSLETWRGAKASAISDAPTSTTIATAVITLGLNAPTAASIESAFNAVNSKINSILGAMRTREIVAT